MTRDKKGYFGGIGIYHLLQVEKRREKKMLGFPSATTGVQIKILSSRH